tara:strand:+ start:21 stop:266 length:246 start_codon:yes stop_codon:yes gene_type:complete
LNPEEVTDDQIETGSFVRRQTREADIEMPAAIHRDLVAYAKVLEHQTGQTLDDPAKLISPMVERFMATDRGFAKLRRKAPK